MQVRLALVEKPTVFRQFTGFACSSQTRNYTKPQGVGYAGTARLAHGLYFKAFVDSLGPCRLGVRLFIMKTRDTQYV